MDDRSTISQASSSRLTTSRRSASTRTTSAGYYSADGDGDGDAAAVGAAFPPKHSRHASLPTNSTSNVIMTSTGSASRAEVDHSPNSLHHYHHHHNNNNDRLRASGKYASASASLITTIPSRPLSSSLSSPPAISALGIPLLPLHSLSSSSPSSSEVRRHEPDEGSAARGAASARDSLVGAPNNNGYSSGLSVATDRLLASLAHAHSNLAGGGSGSLSARSYLSRRKGRKNTSAAAGLFGIIGDPRTPPPPKLNIKRAFHAVGTHNLYHTLLPDFSDITRFGKEIVQLPHTARTVPHSPNTRGQRAIHYAVTSRHLQPTAVPPVETLCSRPTLYEMTKGKSDPLPIFDEHGNLLNGVLGNKSSPRTVPPPPPPPPPPPSAISPTTVASSTNKNVFLTALADIDSSNLTLTTGDKFTLSLLTESIEGATPSKRDIALSGGARFGLEGRDGDPVGSVLSPHSTYYSTNLVGGRSSPAHLDTLDIMTVLDHELLPEIKKSFVRHREALTEKQFVQVVRPYLPRHLDAVYGELEVTAALCQLFSDVDVNGDGTMEWEEFTNFIIDAGMNLRDISRVDRIEEYRKSHVIDHTRHDHGIERMEYFEPIDHFLVFEKGMSYYKVYKGKNFSPICKVQQHASEMLCAEYLPALGWVATASNDRTVAFSDPVQRYRKMFHFTPGRAVVSMRWWDDARVLYTATDDCAIGSWHITGPNQYSKAGSFKFHRGVVLDLLVLQNLHSLASGSLDKSIALWDLATGQRKHTLLGHSRGVVSLAYNPEYHCLVSAGFEHDAFVWNPYYAKSICCLKGHYSPLIGVQTVPGTPQIVTADSGGVIKIWDIRNFGCIQTITVEDEHDAHVTHLTTFKACHPHKRFAVASYRCYLYDCVGDVGADPLLCDSDSTVCCLFNKHSGTFVTAAGRSVKVWSAATGTLQRVYRNVTTAEITALCFDASLKKFFVGDHQGHIKVFNYLSGSCMREFSPRHGREVSFLTFLPQQQQILSASWDGSIRLYVEAEIGGGGGGGDGSTGHAAIGTHSMVKQWAEHKDDITCCNVSQNLTLVASGSANGQVFLWDYDTYKQEGELLGHTSEITCLLFLDPYPFLISADNDGNLCVWVIRPVLATGGVCILRIINTPTDDHVKSLHIPIEQRPREQQQQLDPNQARPVTCMSFFADYGLLYTGDVDGTIKVWSIGTAMERWQLGPLKLENPRSKHTTATTGIQSPSYPQSSPVHSLQSALPRPLVPSSSATPTTAWSSAAVTAPPVVSASSAPPGPTSATSPLPFLRSTTSFVSSPAAAQAFSPPPDLTLNVNVTISPMTIQPPPPPANYHSMVMAAMPPVASTIRALNRFGSYERYRFQHELAISRLLVFSAQSENPTGTSTGNGLSASAAPSFLRPSDVKLLRWWRAHREACRSIHLIQQPPALTSCSFDKQVHVWDLRGVQLGAFQQGNAVKMSDLDDDGTPSHVHVDFTPWKFKLPPQVTGDGKNSSGAGGGSSDPSGGDRHDVATSDARRILQLIAAEQENEVHNQPLTRSHSPALSQRSRFHAHNPRARRKPEDDKGGDSDGQPSPRNYHRHHLPHPFLSSTASEMVLHSDSTITTMTAATTSPAAAATIPHRDRGAADSPHQSSNNHEYHRGGDDEEENEKQEEARRSREDGSAGASRRRKLLFHTPPPRLQMNHKRDGVNNRLPPQRPQSQPHPRKQQQVPSKSAAAAGPPASGEMNSSATVNNTIIVSTSLQSDSGSSSEQSSTSSSATTLASESSPVISIALPATATVGITALSMTTPEPPSLVAPNSRTIVNASRVSSVRARLTKQKEEAAKLQLEIPFDNRNNDVKNNLSLSHLPTVGNQPRSAALRSTSLPVASSSSPVVAAVQPPLPVESMTQRPLLSALVIDDVSANHSSPTARTPTADASFSSSSLSPSVSNR